MAYKTYREETIFGALWAINHGLKTAQFVQKYGRDRIRANTASKSQEAKERRVLTAASRAIARKLAETETPTNLSFRSELLPKSNIQRWQVAEEELFRSTERRVAECLRELNRALDDDSHLPEERRKFGEAARKCICRQLEALVALYGNALPPELGELWSKYRCGAVSSNRQA